MATCNLTLLADHVLLRELRSIVARDCATTAELLARRFPRLDVPTSLSPAAVMSMELVSKPVAAALAEHAPGHVDVRASREEVIPRLRALGLRRDEALRGAAMCDGLAGAPLEERVRCALAGLGRGRFERATQAPSPGA